MSSHRLTVWKGALLRWQSKKNKVKNYISLPLSSPPPTLLTPPKRHLREKKDNTDNSRQTTSQSTDFRSQEHHKSNGEIYFSQDDCLFKWKEASLEQTQKWMRRVGQSSYHVACVMKNPPIHSIQMRLGSGVVGLLVHFITTYALFAFEQEQTWKREYPCGIYSSRVVNKPCFRLYRVPLSGCPPFQIPDCSARCAPATQIQLLSKDGSAFELIC